MKSVRRGLLAAVALVAILVAGCGSSSSSSTSSTAAAATSQSTDKGGKSACSGACATRWPPVTGGGKAVGGAIAADLGTVTRPDGTTQVTYKGHPLYFFIKDKDGGDAYGAGAKAFGASWYVLKQNGSKIDNT
jgi:predicted lipoprotein with Yx(FWY)xxD motif